MPKQNFSLNIRLLLAALLLTGLLAFSARPVRASTYIVTTFADTSDGWCDANCSLREAIAVANLNHNTDTILLQAGTYALTISDALNIIHPVEIIGPGSDLTAITIAAGTGRSVLNISFNSPTTLKGLSLSNGYGSYGGAVNCFGSPLTLEDVLITGNHSDTEGGGLYLMDCSTVITDSRFTNNNAAFNGGAVYLHSISASAKTLQITNSTFTSNSSGSYGGAVFSDNAAVTITASTIAGNTSNRGGGIGLRQDTSSPYPISLALTNSLVMDNSATTEGGGAYLENLASALIQNNTFSFNRTDGNGGGLWIQGPAALTHNTIADNAADLDANQGGSHGAGLCVNNPSLTIRHTILANNVENNGATAADCLVLGSGTFTSQGYNLVERPTNCAVIGTDIQYQDPLLLPLADHGGPTLTYSLQDASPARNGGDPAFAPPPAFDQRGPGYPRALFGRLDIGAFEAGRAFYLPLVMR